MAWGYVPCFEVSDQHDGPISSDSEGIRSVIQLFKVQSFEDRLPDVLDDNSSVIQSYRYPSYASNCTQGVGTS